MRGSPEHYVPSLRYPLMKWQIEKVPLGFSCTRVPVHSVAPEMGGVSCDSTQALGPDEDRPIKGLLLQEFANVEMLPFVDVELYAWLKSHVLQAGVTNTTHTTLHRQADVFFRKYIINHLDPLLVLEIKQWTVYAAMMASESEIRGIDMMAKRNVIHDMGRVARFKRAGEVETPFWNGVGFRLPKFFNMRKKIYRPTD